MTYPPAIQLKNVNLELPVTGHAKHKKPVDASTSVGGRIRADRRSHQIVIALENISFCLERGERLGLVGDNGAGKSTLLRLLAGIYVPTTGTCSIKGRISTLFTSNMGLYPDATGLENVLLMGDLLGIGRKKAQALASEIIEFAELGEYIHMPLRTYSAGMRVRLGFAIATSIEPDVLLIDEVIGTGDQRFKEKATNRIRETIDAAGTLVLASHSPSVIQSFCDQAIWLEGGHIREFGPVDDVMAAYAARGKSPHYEKAAASAG